MVVLVLHFQVFIVTVECYRVVEGVLDPNPPLKNVSLGLWVNVDVAALLEVS